jgi:hypothetical protein
MLISAPVRFSMRARQTSKAPNKTQFRHRQAACTNQINQKSQEKTNKPNNHINQTFPRAKQSNKPNNQINQTSK